MIEKKIINNIFECRSIAKLLFKILLLILIITYSLYTLFSLIPKKSQNFTSYESCTSQTLVDNENVTLNIILDQPIIFTNYLSWLSHSVIGDFGENAMGIPNSIQLLSKTLVSLKMVAIGLILAFMLSTLLIMLSRIILLKHYFVEPILSLSLFHVVFISSFLFTFSEQIGVSRVFAGYIAIVFGSGALMDYYSILNDEVRKIFSKDYLIFAKISGYNRFVFSITELLGKMIVISVSRIPILFSGLILLEVYDSGREFSGLGYLIHKYAIRQDTNQSLHLDLVFNASIIIIIIMVFLFYISEHLYKNLSPRSIK
ncbi:MAG: hypothetical protein H8E71_04160 [Candidatus Marinimicrobia bacterium]|nr:hypothetical protein [Candidatus Neomarinimicrobiota bacterium]